MDASLGLPPKMTVSFATDEAATKRDAFRRAMRGLASGVCIVAAGYAEHRAGIVATSVSSFSLSPPTLLVCVAHRSSLSPALRRFCHFSVNILRASQADLADRFSGQTGTEGSKRFAAGDWITLVTGAPVLVDALASIDCDVDEIIDRHTHSIVLGRVAAVRADEGGDALGHRLGSYFRIGDNGDQKGSA
ncbi:flavin reductase family protein [Pseudolabrys taiwanensis]|nr:flavin reductase family protein [Pseudolabrys taiwanensis]